MEADAEAVAVANELTHKKCWNKMKRLKKKIYIKDNDFCVSASEFAAVYLIPFFSLLLSAYLMNTSFFSWLLSIVVLL